MVVGRADAGQEDSEEEDDGCRIITKSPKPRYTDHKKRKIRDDIPKIRDAKYGALVGELVIALILRDRWQPAIADLELAAAWAHSDPWIELEITLAYLKCSNQHSECMPRCLALVKRTALDFWRLATKFTAPAAIEPRDPISR